MTSYLRRRDLQFRPARGTECSHKRSVRWKQSLPERAFGIDFQKDNTRSGRGTPVAKDGGSVMNDLKFACRQLLKNPGFTAVAVLTLALGIGASVAIFSVVNIVILNPLPGPQPDRLIQIGERSHGNMDEPMFGGLTTAAIEILKTKQEFFF